MTVTWHSWQYLCSSNSQAWYCRASLYAVQFNPHSMLFTSCHKCRTGWRAVTKYATQVQAA